MNALTPDKPRFVAGSIGPTNRQLSISGNVNDPGYRSTTFDEMVDNYYVQHKESQNAAFSRRKSSVLAESNYPKRR